MIEIEESHFLQKTHLPRGPVPSKTINKVESSSQAGLFCRIGARQINNPVIISPVTINPPSSPHPRLRLFMISVNDGIGLNNENMSFLPRRKPVCFYCSRRSTKDLQAAVRRWECERCEAVNHLDEVPSPDFDISRVLR